MTEVALELSQASKRYDDFEALKCVSLAVNEGEIFALLGPNGAGKTTLIQCTTGLSHLTAGTIRVFGHCTQTEYRITRRLVGLVPQEIAFDPFFTPHESLMIHMGLMGVRPDAKRADELLETFALGDRRDAYTRTLSGGMKRRLLTAKALVHRPRLLFLDEPTAGVDVELRRELWREVRRLRDQGTTIVLTTHYLQEAEGLADRIGVLEQGQLKLVQDRDTLLRERGSTKYEITIRPGAVKHGELPRGTTLVDAQTVVIEDADPSILQSCLALLNDAVMAVETKHKSLEDIFVDMVGTHTPKGESQRTDS